MLNPYAKMAKANSARMREDAIKAETKESGDVVKTREKAVEAREKAVEAHEKAVEAHEKAVKAREKAVKAYGAKKTKKLSPEEKQEQESYRAFYEYYFG